MKTIRLIIILFFLIMPSQLYSNDMIIDDDFNLSFHESATSDATSYHAEQLTSSPLSISAHVGAFKNQEEYFKLKYDTDTFLAYGLELFIPLNKISSRLGLLGKVTWMSETGVPLLISKDGPRRVEEGTEKLLKRISNMGIKLNIPFKGNVSMDFMGGLSHGFIKQSIRNVPGFSDTESKHSEWNSFFGGLGMEYNLEAIPMSITSNVIYNHGLIEAFKNRGGTHLSFGIRYHIKY